MKKVFRLLIMALLIIVCFMSLSACVIVASVQEYEYSDLGKTVNKAIKGCVEIRIQIFDQAGYGSGFIIGKTKSTNYPIIITNYHVIAPGIEYDGHISIKFSDKADYFLLTQDEAVEVLGYDADMDIAVLLLKKPIDDIDSRILSWGNSRAIYKGQQVFSIGNTFGKGTSYTQGAVSVVEDLMIISDDNSTPDNPADDRLVNKYVIRHDAAINSGNSGGALFNQNGEIIGVNSYGYRAQAIDSDGYNVDSYYLAHNISFAISSNFAQAVCDYVLSHHNGEIVDASIARVDFNNCLEIIQAGLDEDDNNVLKVIDDKKDLGLRQGDIITKINQIDANKLFFDSTQVCSPTIFFELCYYYSNQIQDNDQNKLMITVIRDGEEIQIDTDYRQCAKLPKWIQELPFW